MDLKTWIKGKRGRGMWLAQRLHISPSYLSQIAAGVTPSDELAIEIEKLTEGAVRVDVLRPGPDWAYLRGTAVSPVCGAVLS